MEDCSVVEKGFEKKYAEHPAAVKIDASHQRQPKVLDRVRQALEREYPNAPKDW